LAPVIADQSLYDDADTTVKSAGAGILRTCLRFAAEMKFNLLLMNALNGMNVRADAISDLRCKALCAVPGSKYFNADLSICSDGCADFIVEKLGEKVDSLVVIFITTMNTLVVVYILFRPSEALPYGTGKWRKSDTALCFHLNEFYCSRLIFWVRVISAFATLYLIVTDILVSRMPLGRAMMYNGSSWIPALIATWHLHKPMPTLASVRYGVFEAELGTLADRFQWKDLLKSGPSICESKLVEAALLQCQQRTEYQRSQRNPPVPDAEPPAATAAPSSTPEAGDGLLA